MAPVWPSTHGLHREQRDGEEPADSHGGGPAMTVGGALRRRGASDGRACGYAQACSPLL